ncbi:MAG: hypothetical protein AAF601_07365 [Pseudomonadota bacterium]
MAIVTVRAGYLPISTERVGRDKFEPLVPATRLLHQAAMTFFTAIRAMPAMDYNYT